MPPRRQCPAITYASPAAKNLGNCGTPHPLGTFPHQELSVREYVKCWVGLYYFSS